MDFLKRLTFLLHLIGFLIGVIALPIMVYFFYDGVDLDDGLLTTIILTFATPVIGWGSRWLILGELSEFFPFQKELFNALPKDGNFGGGFLLVLIFSSLYFFSTEHNASKKIWEYEVFGNQCRNESGDEVILDYYKAPEGSERGEPIYCSDYLELNWNYESLCTWDNKANADTWRCKNLKKNPKPDIYWDEILFPIILLNLLMFYFLTLIRLIYNSNNKNS